MDENEITAAEAAKILDVSERHVRWYHAKGHLAARRVGKWLLIFERDAVEALKLNKPKKTGRPPKPAIETKSSKARSTAKGKKKGKGK